MPFKFTWWVALRSSLWFVPAFLVIGAAAGAVGLIAIDARFDPQIVRAAPRLLTATPDGAREVLSVIASAVITIAGVSFSITIVTLSLASNQYSPRVLRNFMRDRANQMVLGTMVAAFTYCIITLQAIGSGETTFVPHLALWGGILLAVMSIGGLVVFIHHTAVSIQASEIVARIADETVAALAAADRQAEAGGVEEVGAPTGSTSWQEVLSVQSGYIQSVDLNALARRACQLDIIIDVRRSIGDFATVGRPLFSIAPADRISAQDERFLLRQIGISTYRTIEQDPEFGIRQIVDIALKALSPALNDTTTAITCIDYLNVILHAVLRRPPPAELTGRGKRPRILMKEPGFIRLLGVAVNEIRQNTRDNVSIALRLLRLLADLHDGADDPALQSALRAQAERVAADAAGSIRLAADQREVADRYARLFPLLPTPVAPVAPASTGQGVSKAAES